MAQDNFNDKDIEKLLEIAETKKSAPKKKTSLKTKKNDREVEKFIKKFNIEQGDVFVRNFLIYYLYFHSKQRDRLPLTIFFKSFSKHFESSFQDSERGYMLNFEPFKDFTQETYFKARALKRRLTSGKKEKYKKK